MAIASFDRTLLNAQRHRLREFSSESTDIRLIETQPPISDSTDIQRYGESWTPVEVLSSGLSVPSY